MILTHRACSVPRTERPRPLPAYGFDSPRVPLTSAPPTPGPKSSRLALAWNADGRHAWRDADRAGAVRTAPAARPPRLGAHRQWMPRIETTLTLARSSRRRSRRRPPGQVTFDAALDRLVARRMLQAQDWAARWSRTDPRAFDHAVAALVAERARPGTRRGRGAGAAAPAPHWERGRALLGGAGRSGRHRARACCGSRWNGRPQSDAAPHGRPVRAAAFGLDRGPGGRRRRGGSARCSDGRRGRAGRLLIDSDAPLAEPSRRSARVGRPRDLRRLRGRSPGHGRAGAGGPGRRSRAGRPDRAGSAARAAGAGPAGAPGRAVQDETGWKLSTTRAAARVATLLRAARGDAGSDDWLDWLKGCAEWPGLGARRTGRARARARVAAPPVESSDRGRSAASGCPPRPVSGRRPRKRSRASGCRARTSPGRVAGRLARRLSRVAGR